MLSSPNYITRIVWQTGREMTSEIIGAEGLSDGRLFLLIKKKKSQCFRVELLNETKKNL